MREPFAPCKDCTEKYLGCHDHCDKYAKYKEDHAEYVRIIRKARTEEYEMNEIERKRFEKYNKTSGKMRKML